MQWRIRKSAFHRGQQWTPDFLVRHGYGPDIRYEQPVKSSNQVFLDILAFQNRRDILSIPPASQLCISFKRFHRKGNRLHLRVDFKTLSIIPPEETGHLWPTSKIGHSFRRCRITAIIVGIIIHHGALYYASPCHRAGKHIITAAP